ncbi:hypothetical protein [Flavobacterium sp. N2820]|uniref:hypothetical protein n=1 Tax=Flavobacterium sp. N2820 TaxID=2986834 RepID=UPI002224FAAE|nr:hypothetical protein [Flavobacterium sp. N2820]
MKLKLYLFVSFFFINCAFCQEFVVIDNETLDFIEDVRYELFYNKKIVYADYCNNESKTILPINIIFDTIVLRKLNYEEKKISIDKISNIILMNEKIEILNEIVLTNINNEIILGEKNKFVRRRSNGLSKDNLYGLVFENKTNKDLEINKIEFFVEKIKHKTAYRIEIYEFEEPPIKIGIQEAKLGNLITSTDTLYLRPNQKNKIEYIFDEKIILKKQPIFVFIELICHLDENNKSFEPNFKEVSKIKFCLSNNSNYFAKLIDANTSILSENMININAWLNNDYFNTFFSKPHKSSIVTPVVLLYTRKLD